MMRKISNLLLCIGCFLLVERLVKSQTGGFTVLKATSKNHYPFYSPVASPPNVLNQPFYFLGRGVQCYAFVSQDQTTVLKLFKHHRMGLTTDLMKGNFLEEIFSPIIKKREKRMVRLFQSAQIAGSICSADTGVFYTHLMKTEDAVGSVSLYDKLGIRHRVDLDQAEFVLQKKAVTVEEKLHTLFLENDVDAAVIAMESLLSMIENRSKKGIKNKDGKITVNCGFVGDRPLEIDIGSYIYRTGSTNPDPHGSAKIKGTLQLLKWIKRHHPEYLNTCRRRLLDENLL